MAEVSHHSTALSLLTDIALERRAAAVVRYSIILRSSKKNAHETGTSWEEVRPTEAALFVK